MQIYSLLKPMDSIFDNIPQPDLKRDLWGGEFWTDGYYVATVGERADWGVVVRYVKNQGKPKEELRQLELF